MGGSLDVESIPGEGSRFFFTLRLEFGAKIPEEPLSTLSQCGRGLPPGRTKNKPVILIAEDDKLNMKMIVAIVSKLAPAASIVQAEDGEQAVALFREHRPDLVFMDLQMPVKDGLRSAAEIRAMEMEDTPERERCCIVALTADVLPETRGVCLAGGMDDYLTKPVRREEIKHVIERCLGI
jgi:CheY-like chemotaxis protein